MKKLLILILTVALTLTAFVSAMAAPEAIEKKTLDLKADTIFVWEVGKSGTSSTRKTFSYYNVEYIDSQSVNADGTIDVDIPGTDVAGLKAYIWEAGTLEPITYPETIVID